MLAHSRRKFLSLFGKAAAVTGLAAVSCQAASAMPPKKGFIHHVYFWLNNPGSDADKAKLLEGLRNLAKVKSINEYHIGVPADTNREVIDSSYAISWMLVFDDKTAQDSYQEDPIHLEFVKNYSNLWSKVVVYDSVPA
ncbi:stress responsive alpha-beta barrel domain-containing protein [Flammeovirgaceae bacterium 311]|nr:stress responsive alpha-beta barrel domain-containing protein [Flammeovirgaceae bacterium 311]